MPCYSPLKAFRSPSGITFNRGKGFVDRPLDLPCGQCIGCRLERSRQWALRCVHESSLYQDNCFLTLTYSDSNLPKDSSLNVRHFQLFMKKLRKKYPSSKIRFFHCGEYGEKTNRPHYHALLFNFDFSDKVFYSKNKNGDRTYTSKSLDQIWGHGACRIGSVSFQSAAYVARYVVKKVTGRNSADAYTDFHPITGEITRRASEYATMSRRPGIGTHWYEKFKSEVYPSDFVVLNGAKMRPPKAYDRILERTDPKRLARISGKRVQAAAQHADDNTPERLRVRHEVKIAQSKNLKRNIE